MIRGAKTFSLAVAAGLFISIGGTVYLSCADKVIGAVMFSVGLISICYLGLALYTGKIGFMFYNHKGGDFIDIAATLLGNAFGTFLFGFLCGESNQKLIAVAKALCDGKVEKSLWAVFVSAIFCGVLMFTAVRIYRDGKNPIGILFCVPVFILCGFEHSIADMYYFAAARYISFEVLLFLLVVVLGNTVGGLLVPLLIKLGIPQEKKA